MTNLVAGAAADRAIADVLDAELDLRVNTEGGHRVGGL